MRGKKTADMACAVGVWRGNLRRLDCVLYCMKGCDWVSWRE